MSKRKYTREEKREFRKRNKGISLFTSVIVGMFVALTGYFIYNLLKLKGIEDLIRYIVVGVLAVVCILVIRHNFTIKSQPKKSKFIIFIILLALFGYGEYYLSHVISRGVSIVDNLNKDEIKYTTRLVKMTENKDVTKKNISNAKIGIISNEEDTEGYVLAQKLIKKYDISTDNLYDYDEYVTMLRGLYSGEIDACFVPGGYINKFKNISDFENIKDEVTEIDSYSKMMKKQVTEQTKESDKSITEPFTILLMGVDSTDDVIEDSGGLGDTIMVVTFNPKTLNATVFSIPRDTYVPITCYNNALSKITHAASGGDSCMISTVENFIDIDIDYYAKINFKGFVNLVNELGGIDVDVPYSFCETTMWRSQEYMVYVHKGMQHLNGDEALGLARNRKWYPQCGDEFQEGDRNDFVRGQNQQLVVKAIIKKAKTIRSVDQFYDIVDKVSMSLDTNLNRDQILGFYNIFKKALLSTDSLTDGNDVISMQRTFLRGSGGIIYDEVAGTGLYEFVPSGNGLNAITHAMRVNLELEEEEYATSFTFNIDVPYTPEVIGEDIWGGGRSYELWEPEPEVVNQTCGTNEENAADGSCICKSGYDRNSYGSCASKTEDATCKKNDKNSEASNTGGCQCKSGYEEDSSGSCVEKKQETDSGSEGGSSEGGSGGESGGSGGSEGGSGGESGGSGGSEGGSGGESSGGDQSGA